MTDTPPLSIYTSDDSKEVRAAFFKAIKGKWIKRRFVVTQAEFKKIQAAGGDTDRLITIKALKKIVSDEMRKRRTESAHGSNAISVPKL